MTVLPSRGCWPTLHPPASIQVISSIHVHQIIHLNMNANGTATMWQDVNVSDEQKTEPGASGASSRAGQPPVPDAEQVEILKALAAPTRLRIMYALEVGGTAPRVMSVKELAEELGEPQTRLYRHVKVLESAGLIEVAATRMVSGILEQRYRTTGRDLQFGPGLVRAAPDAAEAAVNMMVQMFSEQFFDAYREGRVPEGDFPEGESYRRPKLMVSSGRISPARANSIRDDLERITHEIGNAQDPNGVPVNTLIAFYSPSEPDKS
jgi:DNA-binding transcriptional ArsR family regulator